MVKKKISIAEIKNEKLCKLTYYKRKKGLIKKSIELSVLCGAQTFLTIIGPNNVYTFFTSKGSPEEFIKNHLINISNISLQKEYPIKNVSHII